MSLDLVQEALFTAVRTVLGSIPTQWPNQTVAPTSDTRAKVTFACTTRRWNTAQDDYVEGEVQVVLGYHNNTGTRAATQQAEAFRVAFPSGKVLTSGQQTARIRYCGPSPGRQADNWYQVTVTLGWSALIPR
jgi:hypothetical protein